MGVNKFILFLGVGAALTSLVTVNSLADEPAGAATAAIPECPATLSDAAREQCLSSLDVLLQEELKVATDQRKLDQDTGNDALSDKARGITIPNVLSIYGYASQPLSAVLAYSDNRSLTVHAGEEVPGGFHVDAVHGDPAEVILSKEGATYVLLMGNGGPSINTSAQQNGVGLTQSGPMALLPPSQPVPGAGRSDQ